MKRSPIRKVSKKRKSELALYAKKREKYLLDQPWCEIGAPGCRRKSVEIHHSNHREGKRLLDKKFWWAACRHCHDFCHQNPGIARQKGWLLAIICLCFAGCCSGILPNDEARKRE